MKEYLAKKTTGFYLTAVAAVLAAVGIISYSFAESRMTQVYVLVIAAIAVEAVLVAVSGLIGNKAFLNLASTVNAVLLSAAFIISFLTQLDFLGWVVSGLYSLNQIMGFLIFAVATLIALILNIAASFMELGKE